MILFGTQSSQFVGTAYLKLLALGYLVDNQADLNIIGINGVIGHLVVGLIPTGLLELRI